MTFETFVIKAERSPFVWEIFGHANDLMFDGVPDNIAYTMALEYGENLEYEALKWKEANETK